MSSPHRSASTQFRLHYQPRHDRLPRWLHRVWAWF